MIRGKDQNLAPAWNPEESQLKITAYCKMEQSHRALAEKGLLGRGAPLPGEDLVQLAVWGSPALPAVYGSAAYPQRCAAWSTISEGVCLFAKIKRSAFGTVSMLVCGYTGKWISFSGQQYLCDSRFRLGKAANKEASFPPLEEDVLHLVNLTM